ncbi:MAG: DUF342 domain-containing protein, partial [Leptonema sp. (in: Bacteria)]|nr:DUF342 domain-containing protein [Leptonema sp. (in: bacteria)]
LEKGEPGQLLVENRNNRAWICIYAPGKGGQSVSKSEVIARLKLLGVENFSEIIIEHLTQNPTGQWVELGDWIEPDSEDAKFSIEISNDKNSATMTVVGPIYQGSWISVESVDAGVRAGVDDDLLSQIVNRELTELKATGPYRHSYVIAKSIEPSLAVNGRIKFYFDPFPRARPALIDDSPNSRVDFKKLNLIQSCDTDQLLAEIIAPQLEKPGIDVTGNPINGPKPIEAKLEDGQNTILRNGQIFSTKSGQVKIRYDEAAIHSKIEVIEVLEVEKIDYATGNVDFHGTVVVHDTVADGFQLRAKGDIVVENTVSNAFLQADGDIVLLGGAVGRGLGLMEAAGDVYAKFVQETTISAGHGIYIEEAAIHSRLMAGVEIVLDGGRGDLIGGTSLSGKLLIANRIGSKAEPETKLTLGIDPETFRRLREVEQEIDHNRTNLQKVQQHRRHIDDLRKRGNISATDDETYSKLVSLEAKFSTISKNLTKQRETMQATIAPNREAEIRYKDTVFPNVEVSFGLGIRHYRIDRRPVSIPGRFALDSVENTIIHSYG